MKLLRASFQLARLQKSAPPLESSHEPLALCLSSMTFTDGAHLIWPVCSGNHAVSYTVPTSNVFALSASHLEARIVWDEVSEGKGV